MAVSGQAGLVTHRTFAMARLFLIVSVFPQSGLVTGAAQRSSSPLHLPECVSKYLLKCFPQYREYI